MKNKVLALIISMQMINPVYAQQSPSMDIRKAIDELQFFVDYEITPNSKLESSQTLEQLSKKLAEIEQQGVSSEEILSALLDQSYAENNETEIYSTLKNIDLKKLEREDFWKLFSLARQAATSRGSHWSPVAEEDDLPWYFTPAMAGAGVLTLLLFAAMWCEENNADCNPF